jgi:hypothetical protein
MAILRGCFLAFGAALVFASTLQSQVVELPVPFDKAGQVMVMTPYIAERAALRAPWCPVSGDFKRRGCHGERLELCADGRASKRRGRPSYILGAAGLAA